MKIFGMKVAGALAAGVLGILALGQPGRLMAQGMASIHGRVVNAAGQPLAGGEVKLTTDRSPNTATRKFDYTFPIDVATGTYKGANIKPNDYTAVVYQGTKTLDFMDVSFSRGEDKTVDFDMTRKEYVENMSASDRAAIEEFKKKNSAAMAANSKITNLNAMLVSARADSKAGNYEPAIKSMMDATTAKPDEPILWETLGDAQMGQADAAAKAARAAKATDASVPEKYGAAIVSYQKALTLNAASAKPNMDITATANNQLGQALGKLGKPKDSAAAYEAAATADKPKAGMYYFNEAATLLNANDTEDAAAAADKAIAADPTKADAYYIKGQALIQKVTVDAKTQKPVAPPGCVEAYQKYLDLAPTGPYAADVKSILLGIGQPLKTTYKAGKK